MKKKIILADDHQLLIEGIRAIINETENWEVSAELNSGTDLLNFLSRNPADLVILDLNMPGQDGLKSLNYIKQSYPNTKVLILTSYGQPELIEQVKKMNADGFLIKNSSSAELKEAITAVLNDVSFFPSKKQEQTIHASYFVDDFLKKYQLTKREVDIIKLVCKEMSSKQIAAELFLSEFTVNTHRKNIFRKLDVKNVAGLVNFATENGVL